MTAADLFERVVQSIFYIAAEYGSGTGFLARSDGLVLTNRHVIGGSRTLTLQGPVGATFDADPILLDAHRDLAALRILERVHYRDLSPLAVKTSASLRAGMTLLL